MILFPNAKINLGLQVLSLRTDGYHNIETQIVQVGLCDVLEFIPAADGKTEITQSGVAADIEMTENLVYKAWQIIRERYDVPPVKIYLHKNIPLGAGLGGGSSDGAFMLKGLNDYFKLRIASGRLMQFAAMLGSDCSFFIDNKPALISGKGDILTPSPKFIGNTWICIFFPGFGVSTARAYSMTTPSLSRESLIDVLFMDISTWKDRLVNDFESAVFMEHPSIGEIKQKIYESGAVYASMSGSGSTVFGIYREKPVLPGDLRKWLIWEEVTGEY